MIIAHFILVRIAVPILIPIFVPVPVPILMPMPIPVPVPIPFPDPRPHAGGHMMSQAAPFKGSVCVCCEVPVRTQMCVMSHKSVANAFEMICYRSSSFSTHAYVNALCVTCNKAMHSM